MCIICTEWAKQKLTSKEAFRAIGEILHTSKDKAELDHVKELSEKILSNEVPETESNPQMDKDWWNSTHPEDE